MKCLRALALVVLMIPSIAFAADDPLAGVRDLIVARRYKEARERLEQARDTFAARSDATNEAIAWLMLGVTATSLEQGVAARAELDQAVTKFVALDDHFSAAMALIALAAFEKSEDRLTDAIAVYERVFAMLEKAADPKSRFSLTTLKAVGPTSGVSFDMLGPLVNYPEILKPMVLRSIGFMARDEYSAVLIEAGHLDEAEKQLTLASEVVSSAGGVFGASVDEHFGDLRRRQWRLDEARESYLKALQGGELMRALLPGQFDNELSVTGKLADLELLTGRVEDALVWNDRALKSVRGANNAKRERAVLEDRAQLLEKAGRYEEALALYEDVLALSVSNNDLFREASIHCDLGQFYMFRGLYGSSARHLQTAIGLYQALHEPFIEAPVWILLAEVQMQLEMQDDATAALDNACVLATKSGFRLASAMVDTLADARAIMARGGSIEELGLAFSPLLENPEAKALFTENGLHKAFSDLFDGSSAIPGLGPGSATFAGHAVVQPVSLFRQGRTLFDRGDYEDARTVWQKALAMNPSNDIRAGLSAVIGATHLIEGKRDEAIRYFTQAASALDAPAEDIKVEEMLTAYLGSHRRWYYGLLIEMLVQDGKPWEAFAQAERARARAFLQTVGNHRLNAERGAEPRLVDEAEILRTELVAREQETQRAHGDAAKRMNADLERMRQRYRTLLTRVKVSNPEYESLTNVEPLRMEDVRRELPADTTLISYFLSPKVVNAWVIDSTQARHVALPVDASGMERIVCWARQFGPPVDVRGVRVLGTCDSTATSEEAFDALIAPLLSAVHQHKLVIVPHGVLHYVPFAALRNRQTERYLIDDYTLTYVPSASALRFLRAKESPLDGGALILGDPENSMSRLPGAAEEASAIARRLGATAHLGAAARESLLYAASGRFDLVHMAAHGIYDPKNPLFSKIALAQDETHDGSLTVDEILSTLDLTGVNLVVLSACQSAVGSRSGGDEVVGLTRALLYAGTPGVISTLWNIDDAASAGLMQEFYGRLAGGASVAEALRQAQLAVKGNQRFSNPKYWAAFMLTGDPQGRWKRTD